MSPPVLTEIEPKASARATTPEQWVAGFAEGWRATAGPDAFAAHFRWLLAPNVRLIQPRLPAIVGLDAFDRSFVRPLFALIPDLHGEVERWAARGDTLYIELTLHGSIGRRSISWRACDRVTLRDGLAVERESYFDPAPLVAAIARTPSAWSRFLRLQAQRLGGGLRGGSAR